MRQGTMMARQVPALLFSAGAVLFAAQPARAEDEGKPRDVQDLSNLSIEELARIQVRSASKRDEPIGEAATSIYVITHDDIERSAATSLPELLRLAPNLQVQRVDARQYAITARGFNGIGISNKLLAVIDGRSIYTTLASSIFWELDAPLLEDLQQIEVISGPGGTLYGPNAVNGVISVTSKDSRDTIGGLVRATFGEEEQTLALRYGAAIGPSGAIRVYGNAFHRVGLPAGAGGNIDDDFKGVQGGFRADFGVAADTFTLQGDIFNTDSAVVAGDGDKGQNLLARWTHAAGSGSSFQLQAYYDDFHRRSQLTLDALETFDVESQYVASAGRHNFVIGVGARTTRDDFINNSSAIHLVPESRRLWIVNGFVQDKVALGGHVSLTGGLKVEGSTFAGVQLLPNLRLSWQPNDRNLFWSAISRAVRTPSRIDRQLESLPLLAQSPGFQSEKLVALEAGYRGRLSARTTLSVSLFYNLYDDIRTTEFQPGGALPIQLMNGLQGATYGMEAWATHQVAPWWRLSLGASALGKDFHLKSGHTDLSALASLGTDPDYQVVGRSQMNIGRKVALDVDLRALDDLNGAHVGGYVEADARLGWRISPKLELYVAGQSLLHEAHAESIDPSRAQRNRRSITGGARIRF
jgi:iron complex outermembrane receptor protein